MNVMMSRLIGACMMLSNTVVIGLGPPPTTRLASRYLPEGTIYLNRKSMRCWGLKGGRWILLDVRPTD